MAKPAKILTKRKKFIDVNIPLINSEIELIGNSAKDLKGRTIKMDLTRQLRGKSVEMIFKINEDATAEPQKLTLMPYFIKRMIRKRISYVEDSFETPSQESMIQVKPFLITRNKVSRAVRKTLRNLAKNWIEDYIAEKKDNEIFEDLVSNRMQKPLSLKLKKTYPLSLCEIRILKVLRPLKPEEVPKIIKPKKQEKIEQGIDQLKEIEEEKARKKIEEPIVREKIKKAEKEIKETQKKASKKKVSEEETPVKKKTKDKTSEND